MQHEEDLFRKALVWDWPTCCRWSGQLFQQVSDGSLRHGWLDSIHLTQLRPSLPTSDLRPAALPSASSAPSHATINIREKYNRETDGKACIYGTWGMDCGFLASHGTLPVCYLHIFAWCVHCFKRGLVHREQDCLKKHTALACGRTTRALIWLLHKEGYFALCYIDDFVSVEATQDKALEVYSCFLALAELLGLQLSLDKCFPPTSSLIWLDFSIDARSLMVSIPEEKGCRSL